MIWFGNRGILTRGKQKWFVKSFDGTAILRVGMKSIKSPYDICCSHTNSIVAWLKIKPKPQIGNRWGRKRATQSLTPIQTHLSAKRELFQEQMWCSMAGQRRAIMQNIWMHSFQQQLSPREDRRKKSYAMSSIREMPSCCCFYFWRICACEQIETDHLQLCIQCNNINAKAAKCSELICSTRCARWDLQNTVFLSVHSEDARVLKTSVSRKCENKCSLTGKLEMLEGLQIDL